MEFVAGVELVWLCRDSAASDRSLLVDAVRATEFPTSIKRYVWAGCEHSDFLQLREHIGHERNLAKDEHLIVSYWRKHSSDI